MTLWSRIANRFIRRLVPPVHQRTHDWFAQFEANHEVWERHELTDIASVTPASAKGGHLHPDVELLLDDVDRYFNRINP